MPTLETLAAALDALAATLLADTVELAEGIQLLGSHPDVGRLLQALRALAKDDALLATVLGQSSDQQTTLKNHRGETKQAEP